MAFNANVDTSDSTIRVPAPGGSDFYSCKYKGWAEIRDGAGFLRFTVIAGQRTGDQYEGREISLWTNSGSVNPMNQMDHDKLTRIAESGGQITKIGQQIKVTEKSLKKNGPYYFDFTTATDAAADYPKIYTITRADGQDRFDSGVVLVGDAVDAGTVDAGEDLPF